MADEQNDIFLDTKLEHEEITITIELAETLRTDEVEKFLQLYDNIPKTLEFERDLQLDRVVEVEEIKEMARQLAALPKKQFELYRTKPKSLVSREVLNLPASTLSTSGMNRIETKPKDIELKEMFLDMTLNSNNDISITPTKTAKKKSKKKKKKASLQSSSENDINLTSKDSNVVIESKLLDLGESGSRIAKMNKSMVCDISVGSPDLNPVEETADIQNDTKITENSKQIDAEISDCQNDLHHISPPFGYPLSTDKLIQSAIKLLSCESANKNDLYKIDNNVEDKQQPACEAGSHHSNDLSITSIDSSIDGPVDNGSIKDITRSPDPIDHLKADESIDGDVSSAWDDDDGWQSQGRRSHRKKKKELQSKERSNSKGKQDIQKDSKQINKRQHSRNSHNRSFTGKTCVYNDIKESNLQADIKHNVEKIEKNVEETDSSTSSQAQEKDDKDNVNTGAVFSYRDALLKTKTKPTEELQYNSDSGVDVNSVGSCDSSIHSPKVENEFDLNEAVNYLMKGWNEVRELHKKGQVVYHKDNEEPVFSNKKKNFRKAGWHAKPRHNK